MITGDERLKMLDKLPAVAYRCLYKTDNISFVYASPECVKLFGLEANELTGFLDIVHPEDVAEFKKLHEDTVGVGLPLEALVRMVAKSGELKQVLVRARVAKTDDEGMPDIIEGLCTDITKQLNIKTSQLENRAKTDFFGKMGYGIRTPMNAIIGLSELGLRQDMPASVRDYILKIKEAGDTLMTVLDDVWDYTKLVNGQFRISEQKFDFGELVQSVVDAIKPRAHDAGLDFFVFVDGSIPRHLFGDSLRIRKVLLNLLQNAVKFTSAGYVHMSIATETKDCGTKYLVMQIKDTGRGIKQEDMGRLFGEFAQFDSKTIVGSGIGLALVKGLMELMGGEVYAASIFCVGSIFTLSFVLQSEGGALCEVKDAHEKNVLVYENRKNHKESLMLTLKNLGCQSKAIDTLPEFYDALIKNDFTHAFVDKGLYREFVRAYPSFESTTEIIVTEVYPLYCLDVADRLNGTSFEGEGQGRASWRRGLVAPDARVLVVDDVSSNLVVAAGLLAPYKMRIDTVESGLLAIEAVKNTRYDLILMDHIMPVLDGAQTTLAIRKLTGLPTDCANVPIVALTANPELADETILKENGFSDFLLKPTDRDLLLDTIEKWIPASFIISAPVPDASPKHYYDYEELNLEIEGVDVSLGIKQTGGDPLLYLAVVKKYLESGRKMYGDIAQCVAAGDMELVNVHVHSLNSTSVVIGATKFAEYAASLERAIEQGDMDFVKEELPVFNAELKQMLTNIEKGLSLPEPEEESKKPKALLIDDTEAVLIILNN
ncbi:MAG: ATP-binding protein, partial [Defluviitaleaceae bacterium]|nr:ATP-binding protein [Defluviitaleaceae bacterium]